MRLIILSDSHNSKSNLDLLIPVIKNGVDMIVHAGDNFKDSVYLNQKTGIPVMAVCGNCDWDDVEEDLIIDVDDVRIFLTHGHNYGVKYGLDKLAEVAKYNEADIAVFGHTHIKESREIDGVFLINPGSLSQPRDGIKKTYVIMDINGKDFDYDYYEI